MNCDMQLGKLAEMQFCVDAAKRGLNVSVPQHDYNGYDLIIEGKNKKLYKVQVKSTRTKTTRGCYKICISKGTKNKKRYNKNEVDFFAIYIAETTSWFILPFNVCTSVNIRIYPDKPDHKFTSFLESWHQFK